MEVVDQECSMYTNMYTQYMELIYNILECFHYLHHR